MPEKTTRFIFERATKNTGVYQERPLGGSPSIIGTLYLKKSAVPDLPPGLEVTVRLLDEENIEP